jgi:hypothetical protein
MKFLFADSLDTIDPGFDFHKEEFTPDRRAQHDDVYPHEFFETAPYDGMLVSRAVVGDTGVKGKYTTSQSIRFRRDGARAFLRYDGPVLLGDCGAFSYVREEKPPYGISEMLDYYADCGFTHAVSIDHVILGYDESLDSASLFNGRTSPLDNPLVPEDWKFRYNLTLDLAEQFLKASDRENAPFAPIGIAQGWSPFSYRDAVKRLVDMGYDYVALGGMVPLMAPQILRVLEAVREVAPDVKLHLFGFAKVDDLHRFVPYNIESFDSTSPLLRAFKDGTKNYLGQGRWFTAIRVPDANESNKFKRDILAGVKAQKHLRALEQKSLSAIRAYAAGEIGVEEALHPIEQYGLEMGKKVPIYAYRDVLSARPWENCECRACREAGVEVVVFRGSNRNRRRGFHNLWAFHRQLSGLRAAEPVRSPFEIAS